MAVTRPSDSWRRADGAQVADSWPVLASWRTGHGRYHGRSRPNRQGSHYSSGTQQFPIVVTVHFPACLLPCRSVNPDLRQMVMGVTLKNGGKEEVEAARKLYREAATPDFKIHCLVGKSARMWSEMTVLVAWTLVGPWLSR